MAHQGSLLDSDTPIEGLIFREAFITPDQELSLLDRIRSLDFHEMKMRGVVARRRVIHYGVKYSFETFKASPWPPIPEFLLPLREKAADLASVEADALAEALITAYSPGASIGWHTSAVSHARTLPRRKRKRLADSSETPTTMPKGCASL